MEKYQNADMATIIRTFGDRLRWARKEKKLSQSVVHQRIGIPQSLLSELENDKYESSTWTPALARLYTVNAGWLADGAGHPGMVSVEIAQFENAEAINGGVRRYPVISHIQAGQLTELLVPYKADDGFAVEYGDNDASRWAFFLEIKGDSMLPDFKEGDRVRIDPEVVPKPGDFVAARNTKDEATFKKYRVRGLNQDGNEIFELVPLNEDYPILRSDEMQLHVIGTMTEHRRKYRRNK
ncbi:S24 family peptidase [Paraburkholderia silvatlantica]|nr:S24 family peptidase [Paraburkholderia silvatlantica]